MQKSDIEIGDLVSWTLTVTQDEAMGIAISEKMRQLSFGKDKVKLIRVVFSGGKKYWLEESTLRKVG